MNDSDPGQHRLQEQFLATLHRLEQRGDRDGLLEVAALAVEQGCWDRVEQRPPLFIRGLTARPLWPTAPFELVARLEAAAESIIAEVDDLLKRQEERFKTVPDAIYEGHWDDLALLRDGVRDESLCQQLPTLDRLLDDHPEVTTLRDGCVALSRLTPGSHISPHCGPTNARLRLHMGLRNLESCELRVADQRMGWRRGKCLIFDDSFEHEVVHRGDQVRYILLVDFWHPELGAEQIARYQSWNEQQLAAR